MCSVRPIVFRTLFDDVHPVIIAKDADGNHFQARPEDYYATEAKAWAAVKTGIMDSIEANAKSIIEIARESEAMYRFLSDNCERWSE